MKWRREGKGSLLGAIRFWEYTGAYVCSMGVCLHIVIKSYKAGEIKQRSKFLVPNTDFTVFDRKDSSLIVLI